MRVHGERNNRLYPIDEEQFNFTPVAAFSGGFLRGIYAPRRTRHRFFKSHQHSWWFALGIKRVVCGAFFADLECPIARSRLLPCTGTSLGLFCTCPSVPARQEQGGSPYVFRLPVHFFRGNGWSGGFGCAGRLRPAPGTALTIFAMLAWIFRIFCRLARQPWFARAASPRQAVFFKNPPLSWHK